MPTSLWFNLVSSTQVESRRQGWESLAAAVHDARNQAASAAAAVSSVVSTQASTMVVAPSAHVGGEHAGADIERRVMGADVERRVMAALQPLEERLETELRSLVQAVSAEREAREAGEQRLEQNAERSAERCADAVGQRLADLRAQLAQAAADKGKGEVLPSLEASLEVDGKVEAAAARVERRLARSLAESTASVMMGAEKLARRQETMSRELAEEAEARVRVGKEGGKKLDAAAAALAEHSNATLRECRSAFAMHERRIAAVEKAVTSSFAQPRPVSPARQDARPAAAVSVQPSAEPVARDATPQPPTRQSTPGSVVVESAGLATRMSSLETQPRSSTQSAVAFDETALLEASPPQRRAPAHEALDRDALARTEAGLRTVMAAMEAMRR